jgi:hypothetical protein
MRVVLGSQDNAISLASSDKAKIAAEIKSDAREIPLIHMVKARNVNDLAGWLDRLS